MNPSSCRNRKATQVHSSRLTAHKRSARSTVNLSAAESSASSGTIALPTITDYASIQLALSTVIQAVATGTLDAARAKVLLSGLQIASANLRRSEASVQTARKSTAANRRSITVHEESEPAQETEAIADETTVQAVVIEAPSSEDTSITAEADDPQPHELKEPAEAISETPALSGQGAASPAEFSGRLDYINEAALRLRAHRQRRV